MSDQPLTPHERHQHLLAQDEALAGRADQLAVMLHAVQDSVAGLNERAKRIEDRAESADQKAIRVAKSNRRAVIALIIVAVFTLAYGWLIFTQRDTINRLDQVVADVKTQQAQGVQLRHLGLCPVFQAAVAADSPAERDRFAGGPAAHDEFIRRLNRSIAIMQCPPLNQPIPGGH